MSARRRTVRRLGRAFAAAGVVAFGGALFACSAVLGFDTLHLDPGVADGGPGPGDGMVVGEGGDAASCATADLMTSSQNCGTCGHDCLTAMCKRGVCQPLMVASGLGDPEGIAVDDTNIFVSELDANRIVRFDRIPHGDCDSATVVPSCVFAQGDTTTNPGGLGIDADSLYWVSDYHAIYSCKRSGCNGTTPFQVTSYGQQVFIPLNGNDVLPLELIVKDGMLFYPENTQGAIESVPVGGGAITTYLAGDGKFAPVAIAVDGTNIYFTENGNTTHAADIGFVPRATTGAGAGVFNVVSNAPAKTYGMTLSTAGNLYWTVPLVDGVGDGRVQATPSFSTGGSPVGDVASSQNNPGMVIVDDANVYWVAIGDADAASGLVLYCPLKGCPTGGPIVLASGQKQPRHLAQDATAIYWTDEGLLGTGNVGLADGEVWKVAKP